MLLAAVDSVVHALSNGVSLHKLDCPKCLSPHLDVGAYAVKPHTMHTC